MEESHQVRRETDFLVLLPEEESLVNSVWSGECRKWNDTQEGVKFPIKWNQSYEGEHRFFDFDRVLSRHGMGVQVAQVVCVL